MYGALMDPNVPLSEGAAIQRIKRVFSACGVDIGSRNFRTALCTNTTLDARLNGGEESERQMHDRGMWKSDGHTCSLEYHVAQLIMFAIGHTVRRDVGVLCASVFTDEGSGLRSVPALKKNVAAAHAG